MNPVFTKFSKPVAEKWDWMQKQGNLFSLNVPNIFDFYLEAFPEGTNEIHITRREFDCQTDKQFVRNVGNVVCLKDGNLHTVWGAEGLSYPYDIVAKKMDEYVRSNFNVTAPFFKAEKFVGKELKSFVVHDDKEFTYNHFYAKVNSNYRQEKKYQGESYRNVVGVMRRSLNEIDQNSIETVLGLINEGLLYRGEEHAKNVKDFLDLKKKYNKLNSEFAKEIFIHENLDNGVLRIKNTVIGQLLMALSKGEPLEASVGKYEAMVAPHNYKRPKALVTQAQIDSAMKTIDELNLRNSFNRRHTKISDLSVNDVLWVNRDIKSSMKGGLESLLTPSAPPKSSKKIDFSKAETITVENFVSDIAPNAKSIEVLVSQDMQENFVTLTSPEGEGSNLFSWDNSFGWTYDGDVADSSIAERVKAKGGKVTGNTLRVSLAWFNTDDLDIHCYTPKGERIYYGNRMGVLDVDMNVHGDSTEPVENMAFSRLDDGLYKFNVNQYRKRNVSNVGFTLEVEYEGNIYQYSYPNLVFENREYLSIEVKNGKVVSVNILNPELKASCLDEKWNIKMDKLAEVSLITKSPNHWDESNKQGNLHWMFILKDCVNPDEVRGFYNEFLIPALTPHRRVLESLGDKTKIPYCENQLSGLGFSNTKSKAIPVLIKDQSGKGSIYNVMVN